MLLSELKLKFKFQFLSHTSYLSSSCSRNKTERLWCSKSKNIFFFAVRGPLTVVASPVAEHRLRTRRLSGHGSRAQPLHGMWDLPGPGHEPVSPASAGRLSTTAPPGKPWYRTILSDMQRDKMEQPHKSYTEICSKNIKRASLVAQWLRVCLLMQGTRVRAPVWEDPTCRGAAGPVSHGR